MKKTGKAFLSAAVAAALTVAMLAYLTGLTERKDSGNQYAPFFDRDADFDVLFFGSSHMVYGVYPMELWKDYGIVSYNLAGHGIHLPTTYWVMKNALHWKKPRLVVIDCYLLAKQTKMFNNFSQVHQSFDAFPLSVTKVQTAFDLLSDSAFDSEFAGRTDRTRSVMGLLWGFSQYHNRWNELGQGDFSPERTLEKGAESFNVDVAVPRTSEPTDAVLEENVSTEYLRRMIQDCRREGVEVLLVYLPFPPGEEERMEANTAGMIAREYGVGYINYLDAGVVDYDTDCLDFWSHLNPSGARKVTEHLGEYIREHYDIPDRREDPSCAGWYEDYEAYTGYKLELLDDQTELKNYLTLLQDRHLNACLFLAESGLWSGPYRALLENIGVDAAPLPGDGPVLLAADRSAGGIYCLRPGQTARTSFASVTLAQGEDGAYSVLADGGEVLAVPPEAAAGAVAVDAGGRFAAAALFSSGPDGETRITD